MNSHARKTLMCAFNLSEVAVVVVVVFVVVVVE
jgi:hypothetical protein